MKKRQTRLNVTILLLIAGIVIMVVLDVKFFRDNTASFLESHPYVALDENDVSLDTGRGTEKKEETGTEAGTEAAVETETFAETVTEAETEAAPEETPTEDHPSAVTEEEGSSGGGTGVFSDIFGD